LAKYGTSNDLDGSLSIYAAGIREGATLVVNYTIPEKPVEKIEF